MSSWLKALKKQEIGKKQFKLRKGIHHTGKGIHIYKSIYVEKKISISINVQNSRRISPSSQIFNSVINKVGKRN